MKENDSITTTAQLKKIHQEKRKIIRQKLREFRDIWKNANDKELFEELAFCICAGGFSAKGALGCVERIRPILMTASANVISRIIGHRYPNERAKYLVHTRNYLKKELNFEIKKHIRSIREHDKRRDWLAKNKDIRGIGYKEASHYLRNIGLRGYAILDKHILRCLTDLCVIDSPTPPTSRTKYLETEAKMKAFANQLDINIDELDLVLWSSRTDTIIK